MEHQFVTCCFCPLLLSEAILTMFLSALLIAGAKITRNHPDPELRGDAPLLTILASIFGLVTLRAMTGFGVTGFDQSEPASAFLSVSLVLTFIVFCMVVMFRPNSELGETHLLTRP